MRKGDLTRSELGDVSLEIRGKTRKSQNQAKTPKLGSKPQNQENSKNPEIRVKTPKSRKKPQNQVKNPEIRVKNPEIRVKTPEIGQKP